MVAPSVLPGRAFQRIDRVSRLLFHWRAADLDVKAVTGQAGTLTRASAGGAVVDRVGNLRIPVHSQPRFELVDLDSDAVNETAAFLVNEQRQNHCVASEDFDSTWNPVGTPTKVNAAKRVGAIKLDLIGDDNAAGLEGYSQGFTSVAPFAGDGVKSVTVHLAKGTSPPASGGTMVRLLDTAVTQERLLGIVTWDAQGVPSVAMTTGTYLGARKLANGVYRLHFQTASVTAANAHSIFLYPATTAALTLTETGNVYAGAVMIENAPVPTSYVFTPSAAVATRLADLLTFPFDALPQDLSIYARVARPIHADLAGALGANQGIFDLGNAATNHVWAYFDAAARNIVASIESGGAQSVSAAVPAGAAIEVALQLSDVATAPKVRLDVGAGFGSLSTATPTALAAFGAAQIQAGGINAGSAKLNGGLIALKVAAGLRTLAELREML